MRTGSGRIIPDSVRKSYLIMSLDRRNQTPVLLQMMEQTEEVL